MYGFNRDAQQQATVNTSCWNMYFTCCDGITNGLTWQNSSQNSVFWRRAECHCQVVEFLHKHKKIIKSKFTASNASLNCAEYAIIKKEHFSFLA
jgi:hypothetical protein